ncbi:hypothetical protein K402DRAFT_407323 [Aulographum hederae CBS 113979]|uniref:Uncharacterized protein n=1 Tax=Aulographum hederae CBS 113979 TaxID=1176131 RepID=A0A6G1GPY4_9PEZI|nr:hypothetical protein K402DRAFT_407323 [Aulographum hederae CBS 113979]
MLVEVTDVRGRSRYNHAVATASFHSSSVTFMVERGEWQTGHGWRSCHRNRKDVHTVDMSSSAIRNPQSVVFAGVRRVQDRTPTVSAVATAAPSRWELLALEDWAETFVVWLRFHPLSVVFMIEWAVEGVDGNGDESVLLTIYTFIFRRSSLWSSGEYVEKVHGKGDRVGASRRLDCGIGKENRSSRYESLRRIAWSGTSINITRGGWRRRKGAVLGSGGGESFPEAGRSGMRRYRGCEDARMREVKIRVASPERLLKSQQLKRDELKSEEYFVGVMDEKFLT